MEDDGIVAELLDADAVAAGQRMVGGEDREARFGVQRLELQALVVDREAHEGEVDAAVEHPARLVVPVDAVHVDGDVGV